MDRTDGGHGSGAPTGLRHRRVRGDGVELHAVEAGEGPTVVLLHGFPEFWHSWRPQLRDLAAGGFRVIAPDQRGYNTSGKPERVEAYRIGRLAADVAALIDREAGGRAHLAGHDWGGAVAWEVARRHPGRIDRLAILNAPHPAAWRRAVRRPRQLLRSWYVLFFQLPRLPEAAIRAFDYAVLDRVFRAGARPGAFADDDVAAYKAALDRPGALTAALNWYRANFPPGGKGASRVEEGDGERTARPGRVEAPTLVLWGERDPWLGVELLEGLGRRVADLRVERRPDAGHWLQAEAPGWVSRRLAAHFGGG